jgi:hypothetical protein
MTWSLAEPSNIPAIATDLTSSRTLYYYDGPQLFLGWFGFIEALFVKVEDLEDTCIWLASPANPRLIDLIVQNSVSVRAAFYAPTQWIVQTDQNLRVQKFWICEAHEIPEEMLPTSGAALAEHNLIVPDSIDQVESFFAINFRGGDLKREGMNFSTFRSLVDNSYDAARRILSPISLLGSKSATFDFRVREPVFSSFLIALEEPLINIPSIRRKTNLNITDIKEQFAEQKYSFFNEMSSVVKDAEDGKLNANSVEDRFVLLDTIQHLIPSEENSLISVMFTANSSDRTLNVFVDEKIGLVLHRVFKEAERRPIREIGRVEIINSRQSSFVMLSIRGRQVTCYLQSEWFNTLAKDEKFRNGCQISVSGLLKRRSRRDELIADAIPQIFA